LGLYARTTSQNSLAHFLNLSGQFIVLPEWLFINVRALAGVQPIAGGFAGLNGSSLGLVQTNSLGASIANSVALSRRDQAQNILFSVSPYLLRQYGDYGTLRIDNSIKYTNRSTVGGFGTFPLTAFGQASQSAFTTEQAVRFESGEVLERIKSTTEGVLSQTPMSPTSGLEGRSTGPAYSSRQVFTNKLAYALSRSATVFGTLGYESIRYQGGLSQDINGIVWSLGITLLPNPDSTVTLSYGKREGALSLAFDGVYSLTSRTRVSASYSNRLATQLQNLERELDQSTVTSQGILVESLTGTPITASNNGLALQPGLFRYDLLSANIQTDLNRDSFRLSMYSTTQSPVSPVSTSQTSKARTISLSWQRELRPDLSLTAVLS